MSVKFNRQELRIIMAALHAVSPTGGGSDTYTIARKIGGVIGVEDGHGARVVDYQARVLREFQESCGGDATVSSCLAVVAPPR